MMARATQAVLFEEPPRQPTRTDGPWFIGPPPDQWRFATVGEDGEWTVIYGHSIRPDQLGTVLTHRAVGVWAADAGDYEGRLTWARFLTCCPFHHPPLLPLEDCEWCGRFERTGSEFDQTEWWDWSTEGNDPTENQGMPGYFPVTIIDMEP